MTPHFIAMVAHEANRALCIKAGDLTQPHWEDAPEWQRESSIKGVEFALKKGSTPEEQHEAWSRDKLADGWVYGPVKDAHAKTHPCLVPYCDLPAEQQIKDHVFVAIVRALGELL